MKEKNAFHWQGQSSIWTKDPKLKQVAAGHVLGLNSRERIKLTEKKQVIIYSMAKLKEKENGSN
jgi:hypothetical protein